MVVAVLAGVIVLGGLIATPFLLPAGNRPSLPSLSLGGIGGMRTESNAPTATEEYMRGNQQYDAKLVWDSISDEQQGQLQAIGKTVDSLQKEMTDARDRGYKVEDVSFVGGRQLPDGTSMAFYLVGVRQDSKSSLEYVPFLFTLDAGGKIARVQ
jgi:hypothetical protein